MKCLAWIVLTFVGLILVAVDQSAALPKGCYECAKRSGFPQEKCCNECPTCRYNFDVEAPKDPGCQKPRRYHYDVEKITGCHKETYDRLDAAVEVLPRKGCRKSYQYHYDVEEPCHCNEESYDTYDFEVVAPKKEKHCRKVKLEAYADHPVRECQCDCNQRRRYVNVGSPQNRTILNSLDRSASTELNDNSDRNHIRRLKRDAVAPLRVENLGEASWSQFLNHARRPNWPPFRRLPIGPRMKRKEKEAILTNTAGYVCQCLPTYQQDLVAKQNDEMVSAPRRTALKPEPEVYIGDSSNPITYEQIKRHMDALPKSEYSPSTNDIIGNLTVLFYDIYQQKHKKNFTLPLKYGTRTVVEKGDGLQEYDIKPIEGEYQPPKLNRFASKGLRAMGRTIDRKTEQQGMRRNRLQRRP